MTIGMGFGFAQARAETSDTVVVRGYRPEINRRDSPGRQVEYSRYDATRGDTQELLKSEASVVIDDTGKPSPSGFVVPRLRGQEVRYTEIWIDDINLQDPFSGLPIATQIDVRAFEAMQLFYGIAPYSLPTTANTGTIRYTLFDQTPDDSGNSFIDLHAKKLTLGTLAGDVSGNSYWGRLRTKATDFTTVTYLRSHKAKGDFRHYDNNGTPYNSDDDSNTRRHNNDTNSWQLLPALQYRKGDHALKALGWIHRANEGISTIQKHGQPRQTDQSQHLFAQWQWRPSPYLLFSTSLGSRSTSRSLHDHQRTFLINFDRSKLATTTNTAAISIESKMTPAADLDHALYLHLQSKFDMTPISLQASSDDDTRDLIDAKRTGESYYIGLSYLRNVSKRGGLQLHIEPRFSLVHFNDSLVEINDRYGRATEHNSASSLSGFARGRALVMGLKNLDSGFWRYAWVQGGVRNRPPSLQERFGDGSTIIENLAIKNESLEHREIGFRLRPFASIRLHFEMAAFAAYGSDLITIVPASSDVLRAQNIGRSKITGQEFASQWSADSPVKFIVDFSAIEMKARDLSGGRPEHGREARDIPGIAPRQINGSLQFQQDFGAKGRWSERIAARYRDQLWRDSANQIAVPAHTIWDAHLSNAFSTHRNIDLTAGVAILNVFDTNKLLVEAKDSTASRGYAPYSDLDGAPLPGRSYRMEIIVSF